MAEVLRPCILPVMNIDTFITSLPLRQCLGAKLKQEGRSCNSFTNDTCCFHANLNVVFHRILVRLSHQPSRSADITYMGAADNDKIIDQKPIIQRGNSMLLPAVSVKANRHTSSCSFTPIRWNLFRFREEISL